MRLVPRGHAAASPCGNTAQSLCGVSLNLFCFYHTIFFDKKSRAIPHWETERFFFVRLHRKHVEIYVYFKGFFRKIRGHPQRGCLPKGEKKADGIACAVRPGSCLSLVCAFVSILCRCILRRGFRSLAGFSIVHVHCRHFCVVQILYRAVSVQFAVAAIAVVFQISCIVIAAAAMFFSWRAHTLPLRQPPPMLRAVQRLFSFSSFAPKLYFVKSAATFDGAWRTGFFGRSSCDVSIAQSTQKFKRFLRKFYRHLPEFV